MLKRFLINTKGKTPLDKKKKTVGGEGFPAESADLAERSNYN